MNLMDLFIKIGVKDEASGPISKLTKSIGKGLATAAKLGTAAIGAAGTAIGGLMVQSVKAYGEYEQLVGGAKKIFDQMDYSIIAADAAGAWETMNLSASEYLAMMNSVGATFAATMGDQKGYETAKRGMQAIADYASGTGRNVGELNDKFSLITRSTQSYQSIADQFSGILPATSKDFLEQAQAAGFLSDKYKNLTEVPIDEYQQAVSLMLEKGVHDLNLTGNTAEETAKTITGSLAGMKAAWKNLLVGFGDSNADLNALFANLMYNAKNFLENVKPVVKTGLKSIAQLVKEVGPDLVESATSLLAELLPELLPAAIDMVAALVTGIANELPNLLSGIWDAIKKAVSGVDSLDWLESILEGIENFAEFLQSGSLGADAFVAAIVGIATAIGAVVAAIKTWTVVQGVLNAVMSANPIGIIIVAITALVAAIVYLWNTSDEFRSAVTSAWEAIKATAVSVAQGIASAFQGAWEAIKSAFSAVGEFFGSVWQTVSSKFTELGQTISSSVTEAVTGGVNAVLEWAESIINNAIGLVNKVIRLVNKIPGVSIGELGDIALPRAAIGNDYIPYNGYIAELHRGEAILTAREAEDWRRGQGSGQQVVNNFTFNGVSQSDLDYIVAYVNRGLA